MRGLDSAGRRSLQQSDRPFQAIAGRERKGARDNGAMGGDGAKR